MLPKKLRIKKSTFPSFQGKGRSFFVETMTVRVVSNGTQEVSRASVVVSKKVAKGAVERNHIRRRVYATLYPEMTKLKPGLSLVFYPKKTFLSITRQILHTEIEHLLNESRVYRSSN